MEQKDIDPAEKEILSENINERETIEIFSPELLKYKLPSMIYGLDDLKPEHEGGVLTIGNFDGVHKGHLHLLKKVIERAKELKTHSIVFTMWPPPFRVLKPYKKVYQITSLDHRFMLIGRAGIDHIILEDFNIEFASISAEDFIKDIIIKRIKPKEVVVGHDFSFGKAKRGTPELLTEILAQYGVRVTRVPPLIYDGKVISSTLIRKYIMDGKIREVALLTGRYYYLCGKVVEGYGVGKNIGFPTANIGLESEPFLKPGVYAVLIKLPNVMLKGVMNFGVRPTFNRIGYKLQMEVHIPGFNENINDLPVVVHIVKGIRDEIKFKNAEFLKAQIKRDISYAMRVLDEIPLHLRI